MPIVSVTLGRGRSVTQKRALLAAVSQAVSEHAAVPPSAVRVVLHEVDPDDYWCGEETLHEKRTRLSAQNQKQNQTHQNQKSQNQKKQGVEEEEEEANVVSEVEMRRRRSLETATAFGATADVDVG